MVRLMLLWVLQLLTVIKVAGQDQLAESPHELLLSIQKSKLDTNRIRLQLTLGSYYLYKDGEFKNDLDSARYYFNQAAHLSNKLRLAEWQYETLALIGNYYVEAGDLERCRQHFMRVITYYNQTKNTTKEADTWTWLGDLYFNNYKDDHQQERIGFYKHARALYLQNHQSLDAANTLANIGSIYVAKKQFNPGERMLLQALNEYKAIGYSKLHYTYEKLYQLEFARGNYFRAMRYVSEGIRSMNHTGDKALAPSLYGEMARCNYRVRKYPEALVWIHKAIAAKKGMEAFQEKCLKIRILLGLNRTEEAYSALTEVSKGKSYFAEADKAYLYLVTAHYYTNIHKTSLALQYYLKALDLELRKDADYEYEKVSDAICHLEIAKIYLAGKDLAKAEIHLNSAASLVKSPQIPMRHTILMDFYRCLYKYNLATGNYKSAVKNLELHDRIKDSIFTADKDKQIAELNIQYETAQRKQSIKDLHNRNAVQQARLQKANLHRNLTIGGVLVMIAVSSLLYKNYKQKQFANYTITHKNELLQHLLTEKEWLLKEVHHRVKNNLHTVICLLESQAAYLENDALKAIENSQNRIFAMSLIHQKLYQSEDIKTIQMTTYIPELVQSLENSFDIADQVLFRLTIDPIKLGLSHAIPLGLIINEAVTNSIKYAFPNNRQGEISISLTNYGARVKLEMADNGMGIPGTVSESEGGSFGLELMKGLSNDIDAEITFEVSNGTRIIIVFTPDELTEHEGVLKLTEDRRHFYEYQDTHR